MTIKTCFVVLGSLLSFLGCSSREDSLPIFPKTDNAAVQVSQLPIPPGQFVAGFTVSKDGKQIYVCTYREEDANSHHPGISYHWLVFDQSGSLQRELSLNLPSEKGDASYALHYTTEGLLVLTNSDFIHFIDPQTARFQTVNLFRATAHPLLNAYQQQAEAEAKAEETIAIQHLNATFHLRDTDIRVENKAISADYWAQYRAIKSGTALRVEDHSRVRYNQLVRGLLSANSTPLRGIQTDRFNYVLLPYGTGNAFFDLNGLAYSGRIGWTTWQLNKGLHFPQPGRSFIREGDEARDSNLMLTYQGIERTSSVADDFAGRPTNDYLMQVQLGAKTAHFKLKNRPLFLADNSFFGLLNGRAVVQYQNQLYLIR